MREMVDQKRLGKLDEAKAQVIEEMRDKFLQLDLEFDEVTGINRRRRASSLPPKYQSPDGKTWSGGDTFPCGFGSMKRQEEAGKITL